MTGEKGGGDRFRENQSVLYDDEVIIVRGYGLKQLRIDFLLCYKFFCVKCRSGRE